MMSYTNNRDVQLDRLFIESAQKWRDWVRRIPNLSFKEDWLVKIIPPFGGAMARFLIAHKDNPGYELSIYLDCFDSLGCVGEPYWEVYPVQGEPERLLMEDTEGLLLLIERELGLNKNSAH